MVDGAVVQTMKTASLEGLLSLLSKEISNCSTPLTILSQISITFPFCCMDTPHQILNMPKEFPKLRCEITKVWVGLDVEIGIWTTTYCTYTS